MAELADAHGSGPCLSRGAGSTPVRCTTRTLCFAERFLVVRGKFVLILGRHFAVKNATFGVV